MSLINSTESLFLDRKTATNNPTCLTISNPNRIQRGIARTRVSYSPKVGLNDHEQQIVRPSRASTSKPYFGSAFLYMHSQKKFKSPQHFVKSFKPKIRWMSPLQDNRRLALQTPYLRILPTMSTFQSLDGLRLPT